MSTSISVLVSSRPAQGATSCILGEIVHMTDPVVRVVEGQGDPTAEQTHWAALEFSLLRGGLEMGLGERTWQLEHAP